MALDNMRVTVRKGLIGVLIWLCLLSGCNGEPTYQGLSFITYNYTPWDLEYVRLEDVGGRKAGMGSVSPGGGEGAVSCCYTLKGTEFNVRWRGGDGALMQKYMNDEKKYESAFFTKTTPVSFPAEEAPPGDGPLYLELHIYPDEHMEMALSRKLLGQVRIPIVKATRWLYDTHRDSLKQYGNIYELQRVLAKVARVAWMNYRIEDLQDMQQYMYFYFTVASDFDKDPDIEKILRNPTRKAGDFSRAISGLAADKVSEIREKGKAPGDKNV